MNSAKSSYWLTSGILTTLERLSLVLFGFGGFFLLVRVLPKEDFGVWSLFMTVTSLIEVARNGLIQNAQIKFMASSPAEEHPKIMTASLVLNFILTGFTVVALLCFAKLLSGIWDSPALEPMFYFYILTTVSLIFHSQFNFIQQGSFDFKGIFWSNFLRQGSFFGFICFYFVGGHQTSLITLVNLQTVAAVLGAGVSYYFVRKYLRLSPTVDWSWVRKLYDYGKYVFGTNVSSMVFKSIDQFMLGSMVSTSSVAVYNTAVRVANLVEVPTMSVASIVFPQSALRMATEGKAAVGHLYEKSVGLLMALILPMVVFVLLFADYIILLIAGESYREAAPILQITILYSLFLPFARQFGTVLDSIGMPKTNFLFIAVSAVLNIGVNYVFIQRFGLKGAAYGSLVTNGLYFVATQIMLSRILNVRFGNILVHTKGFYLSGYSVSDAFLRKKLARTKP